jgi:hypothetical protein
VKTFEGAEEFCGVQARTLKVESLLLLKMMEQLSAVHKRKDEVELLRGLEGELERDDEGVIDLG